MCLPTAGERGGRAWPLSQAARTGPATRACFQLSPVPRPLGARPRTPLHSCSERLRALLSLRPDLLPNQPVLGQVFFFGGGRGSTGLCGLDSASQGLWVSLAGSSPGTLGGPSYEHMGACSHSEKGCREAEPPAPATPAEHRLQTLQVRSSLLLFPQKLRTRGYMGSEG